MDSRRLQTGSGSRPWGEEIMTKRNSKSLTHQLRDQDGHLAKVNADIEDTAARIRAAQHEAAGNGQKKAGRREQGAAKNGKPKRGRPEHQTRKEPGARP